MTKLSGVPGMVVDSVWPDIEPFVARCLEKTNEYRWLPEDILGYIREGDLQLWLCLTDGKLDGIVITQLDRAPRAFECNVFMMSGSMPETWREGLEQLENWARSMGCTHMCTLSRPGSAKLVGYPKHLIRTVRAL